MRKTVTTVALVYAASMFTMFAQDKSGDAPSASVAKPDILVLAYSEAKKSTFDWGNLTWFAGRSLGNSTEMTVGRCVLKPGRSNPRHYHPNCTEILVVIQGSIEHAGPGGKKVKMGAGDTVTIPPNTWHQATNIGDTEAVLFIVFSSADRQTVGE